MVNFLSHPVVNGFTNAAAIIIASSQLSKMFGVSVDKAEHHYETIIRVVESAAHYTHWPTLLMGALAFGIMISLKRINPKSSQRARWPVAVDHAPVLGAWASDHDAKSPIDAVRAPEVRQEVSRFNTVLAEIETLNVERTGLNTALDEARSAGNTIGVLDVEHDLSVLNVRIARLKHEAETLRGGSAQRPVRRRRGDRRRPRLLPARADPGRRYHGWPHMAHQGRQLPARRGRG